MAYEQVADLDAALDRLRALVARTVIFDVEPLVAYWDTDQHMLERGVDAVRRRVAAEVTTVEEVVFATNSARRLPSGDAAQRPRMRYLADAAKPLQTAPYRDLPRPGVVVGDQVVTDGVLARRLGFVFLHCRPTTEVPLGPRLMSELGRPLRSLLFGDRGR